MAYIFINNIHPILTKQGLNISDLQRKITRLGHSISYTGLRNLATDRAVGLPIPDKTDFRTIGWIGLALDVNPFEVVNPKQVDSDLSEGR